MFRLKRIFKICKTYVAMNMLVLSRIKNRVQYGTGESATADYMKQAVQNPIITTSSKESQIQ